jgi:hypothetical protein
MYCCKYGFQSDTIVVSRWLYSADLIGCQCHAHLCLCLVLHRKRIKTEEILILTRFFLIIKNWSRKLRAEYNQRETTIVSDWKPYLQQYTQIIKTPTLQTYFSYILSKLKRTRNQMTSDLYVLNWKSSYDVMLLMYGVRNSFHEWSVAERVKRRRISHTSGRNPRSSIETSVRTYF